MWLAQSAIPHVPSHARLPAHVVEAASEQLMDAHGAYSAMLLSRALKRCERKQPALAAWLEKRLSGQIDDAARGLGASMAMTIWLAFALFAGPRLRTIRAEDCSDVDQLLQADQELRRSDPSAIFESDDIIAVHQPEVAKLIRTRMDETLSAYAEDIDVDDVDAVYHMLLVEVLVLSYAVEPVQPGPGQSAGAC